ncbi:tetratricopeptide repeat protein [Robertmurraya yapensis]|uniref:Tetratricopeptide repeat protein n=1 Tax=Bacillus yapensis TaxID=2492960 RepID=A0A431W2B9_9BACI|nr:tetratricopeptide repeat protein [Bacillus yapensis]RTR29580.1 tetratricopeptide repeat protein [Bacillus yapensis]TKS94926.1 tetratricopeptide repeat protein [Bacillus yapensis]
MNNLSAYLIGDTIKSFREYKKLTIEELSEGVCTEEELIEFEKEVSYPDLETLNLLLKKLNVDLSYFFNVASRSSINYANAVIRLINRYKRDWDYDRIQEIIEKELENPIFQTDQLKQFLIWHQGICKFYLDKDLSKALELLYESIDITNKSRNDFNERETEILTSIAILHKESGNFEEAITLFKESLNYLENLPDILDPRGKIRVYFGLSQALTEVGKFEESLEYCKKGIEYCITHELIYLLSSLYYQSGENLIKLSRKEEGIQYINSAIYILKVQENKKFIKIIENEKDKLLQEW